MVGGQRSALASWIYVNDEIFINYSHGYPSSLQIDHLLTPLDQLGHMFQPGKTKNQLHLYSTKDNSGGKGFWLTLPLFLWNKAGMKIQKKKHTNLFWDLLNKKRLHSKREKLCSQMILLELPIQTTSIKVLYCKGYPTW